MPRLSLRPLVLAALFTGTAAAAWAQASAPAYRFRQLTMADGLPQSSVYTVLRDQDGFVWLGTGDGLARFDGYRFTVYRPAAGDSATLPSGQVWDVAQTANGALYAATSEGLGRLDLATGRVQRLVHRAGDPTTLPIGTVLNATMARDGALLVTTPLGIARVAPATGLVRRLTSDDEDSPHAVRCPNTLLEARDGSVWAGTNNGLARIDPLTGRVTRLLHREDTPGCRRVPGQTVLGLVEAGPGLFYAATDQGLVRIEARTGTTARYVAAPPGAASAELRNYFRELTLDPLDPDVLWIASASGLLRFDRRTEALTPVRLPGGAQPDVRTVYADRSGLVWVGTYLDGVYRFDPHEVGFRTLRYDPDDANSLAAASTYGMLAEQHGTGLWAFGDGGAALTRYDRATGRFQRLPGASVFEGRLRLPLYEDHAGTVWRAVPEGVMRYDRATGRFRLLASPAGPTGTFNAIGEDARGHVWVASRGGLSAFDPRTNRAVRYAPVYADSNKTMHRGIAAALLDHPGRFLLVLTDGEAFTFSPEEGRYRSLGYATTLTPDGRGFPQRFYRDHAGQAWLVLHKAGLVGFDLARRRFVPVGMDRRTGVADGAYAVHERAQEPGILWVGTWSGLDRVDTRTGAVRHYTERDGLANGYIYGILEDRAGQLWLSTNHGLSRFDPARGTFRAYGPEHGLQGYEFNGQGYAQARDGEMFFGGVNGISAFYPDRLRDDPSPPTVRITGLRLFNRPVEPGTGRVLPVPLNRLATLTLPYDQNVVTFEFVGLHFKAPEQNRYRYRLEGFDKAWLDGGTRREATYTNLRPGRYRLRVQAANADGVWNRSGATLAVVVTPPWWRTPGAYLAYGLLFVGLVFGAARGQRRLILHRERLRTQRLADRLRAEAAEARLDAVGRELAVAQRIQQGALPRTLPQGPGSEQVEVAAEMIPAREVGGDLYDYFWVDDCCLAFAVGDVSGKGVPAALFMALTRNALRAVALTGLPPEACLARANAILHEEAVRGMFVSLFYGVLDVRTGTLTYANAGHLPPLIVHADGTVTLLPLARNLALCLSAQARYEARTYTLAPGESLLVYTDGVTEAVSATAGRFEDARLAAVAAAGARSDARAQVARVVAAVEAFAEGVPQADDVTALAVRLHPRTPASGDGTTADVHLAPTNA